MLIDYTALSKEERNDIFKEIYTCRRQLLIKALQKYKKVFGYKPHLAEEQAVEIVENSVLTGDKNIITIIDRWINDMVKSRFDFFHEKYGDVTQKDVLYAIMYHNEKDTGIKKLLLQTEEFTAEIKAFVLQDSIARLINKYEKECLELKTIAENGKNDLSTLQSEMEKRINEQKDSDNLILKLEKEIDELKKKNALAENALSVEEKTKNDLLDAQLEVDKLKSEQKNKESLISKLKKDMGTLSLEVDKSKEKSGQVEAENEKLMGQIKAAENSLALLKTNTEAMLLKSKTLSDDNIKKDEEIALLNKNVNENKVVGINNNIYCMDYKTKAINYSLTDYNDVVNKIVANINSYGLNGDELKDYAELLYCCWRNKMGMIIDRNNSELLINALSLVVDGEFATVLHVDKEYSIQDYIDNINKKKASIVLIKNYLGNYNEIMLFSLSELMPDKMFVLTMENKNQVKYLNDAVYNYFVINNFSFYPDKEKDNLDNLIVSKADAITKRENHDINSNFKKSVENFGDCYFEGTYYNMRKALFVSNGVLKFLVKNECKLVYSLDNKNRKIDSFGEPFEED